MNARFDADRILEDWLEEGPSQLPDPVIESIVGQLDDTRQRRPGWPPGRSYLPRLIMPVAAVALLLAAVAFAQLGGALPIGRDPVPSNGPDFGSFSSIRHRYTVIYPDTGWTIVERPGDGWEVPATAWSHDMPGVDYADKIGANEPIISFNSQPLPSHMDGEAWLAAYDASMDDVFPECSVVETASVAVDGEDARVNTYVCDETRRTAEAIVFHEGRVHAIRVSGLDQPEAFEPRPLLEEWLASFRFLD